MDPEDEEWMDIQPSELPFGDPERSGPTDKEGWMDVTALWGHPPERQRGNPLPSLRKEPLGTIRQMDLKRQGERGNPILEM